MELPMMISQAAGLSPQVTRERSVADLPRWARGWVDSLGPKSRLVVGYQLGWWDASGAPAKGGQALRAALVLLCAKAVGGTAQDAGPAAVGAEFVHAFSLMHDDVMDRDSMRRHRAGNPAAWTVF